MTSFPWHIPAGIAISVSAHLSVICLIHREQSAPPKRDAPPVSQEKFEKTPQRNFVLQKIEAEALPSRESAAPRLKKPIHPSEKFPILFE